MLLDPCRPPNWLSCESLAFRIQILPLHLTLRFFRPTTNPISSCLLQHMRASACQSLRQMPLDDPSLLANSYPCRKSPVMRPVWLIHLVNRAFVKAFLVF